MFCDNEQTGETLPFTEFLFLTELDRTTSLLKFDISHCGNVLKGSDTMANSVAPDQTDPGGAVKEQKFTVFMLYCYSLTSAVTAYGRCQI